MKYNNFKVTSKSTTLKNPTSDSRKVYKLFEDIFDDFYDTSFPLRLIGVAASKVIEAHDEIKQLSIFDALEEEQKEVTIDNLIKIINNEVGSIALKRGIKDDDSLNNVRTDKFDKSKG